MASTISHFIISAEQQADGFNWKSQLKEKTPLAK